MLIEASRGGHANVANLLLRQPRYLPRKLSSPEPSGEVTSTTNRQPALEGRERKGSRKSDSSRAVPAPKEVRDACVQAGSSRLVIHLVAPLCSWCDSKIKFKNFCISN